MDIVGLDLHKRESQLASKAPDGTITDRRIVTSRDRHESQRPEPVGIGGPWSDSHF